MIADLEVQETRDEMLGVLEPKSMREKSMFAFLYGNDSYVQLGGSIASGRQNPYTHMQRRIFDPLKRTLQQSVGDSVARETRNANSGAIDTTFGAIGSPSALLGSPSASAASGDFTSIVEEARRARTAILGANQP
jgi:hypothetical protein